jgi:cobalamin biosynthesis protein CobT
MRISRKHAEDNYLSILANEPSGLGATRSNLSRLLRTLDFVGWSTHEESGRLDRRALTRYASGSANIFSRRDIKEAEKSAVSVLIDCSGSMDGRRIRIAEEIAVHLSRLLNRAKVPFAINGFHNDKQTSEQVGGGDWITTSTPTFIPFKRWGEAYGRVIAKLGSISECAIGGTPDYSAIYNAIEDISKRSESRKILFILTDAEGYSIEHMRHLQKFADTCGVTIVAIGIGNTDVTRCFTNSSNVINLSDLASTTFNSLLKTVEKKIR